MTGIPNLVTDDFRALSARLGQDPLQVQGPGGNTSIKSDDVMWIKASGTELANAEQEDIFVPVDRGAAISEARGTAGDGSCKDTVLDPAIMLRPSIETTFHAALDHKVVLHTHSVSTLVHAICDEGIAAAQDKLAGLPFAIVPYAKPGLPLTQEILARAAPDTKIFILRNHGLIGCGASVEEAAEIVAQVEARLAMPTSDVTCTPPIELCASGFHWAEESWLAQNTRAAHAVLTGSYYPDHVVFLGPGLPAEDHLGSPPAVLQKGIGVMLRDDATSSQRAMLRCLSDVFARLPREWSPLAIGEPAEAELLNWDAEKYRQALAARS